MQDEALGHAVQPHLLCGTRALLAAITIEALLALSFHQRIQFQSLALFVTCLIKWLVNQVLHVRYCPGQPWATMGKPSQGSLKVSLQLLHS